MPLGSRGPPDGSQGTHGLQLGRPGPCLSTWDTAVQSRVLPPPRPIRERDVTFRRRGRQSNNPRHETPSPDPRTWDPRAMRGTGTWGM